MAVTIYHNPRCNTSRKTLALLRDKGVEPEIVEYLKTPYTAEEKRKSLKEGRKRRTLGSRLRTLDFSFICCFLCWAGRFMRLASE